MKHRNFILICLILLTALGCRHAVIEPTEKKENAEMKIEMSINEEKFEVKMESSQAAEELMAMLPQSIELHDFGGFEKVGDLGVSLTASDKQTVTNPGDLVLYQGNQIVLFYGSNSWRYTRLGHVDDVARLQRVLGTGKVTIVLRQFEETK